MGRAVLHLHPAGPHHRHVHLVRQPVRRGRHADRPITGIGGKCLDVTDNSSADGTPAQIWSCTGGANQQWTRAADGTLRSLGKCLDVAGGGTADGTRVQLWTCNGSAAQQWTWTAGRDLVNPQANKCLDVTGNTSADGTKTQIWSCTGGANQKWTLPS
ncbi:lectin [Micromonospora sp. MH33]|uniref:lectin n=1 Tax=Micromonospora sp. MH33 TaxID=1945509 RepID=UPI0032B16B8B